MVKRPILLFTIIVSLLIAGIVMFLQSPRFAQLLKKTAIKYVPKNLGIHGDFERLSVKMFPPGISINQPKVQFEERNVMNIPAGSNVNAERIDLTFLPFQIFSGNIRVHQVTIVKGDVKLIFDPNLTSKATPKRGVRWSELLQIRADAFAVEDSRLRVELPQSQIELDFMGERAAIAQTNPHGNAQYELDVSITDIQGKFPADWKIPNLIDRLRARATINEQGIKVDELSVSNKGTEIQAQGTVLGDLLNPKSLWLDGSTHLRGKIEDVFPKIPIKGLMNFKGKVRGNLQKPLETLKADGSLIVERLELHEWTADRVFLEGQWNATPQGGDIVLKSGTISSESIERQEGNPASGGKIEIAPFTWSLGSDTPLQAKLKLEKSHIHWLAAGAIKSLFALDFRSTGELNVEYFPAKKGQNWKVTSELSLDIPRFQLDNQRLHQKKPLHRIVRSEGVKLKGRVEVDSTGIRPNGLTLFLPHSQYEVTGEVKLPLVYDLKISGQGNLSDVGELAENKIRGEGPIEVFVHGPSARVFIDFDLDVKDGYFLRLKLGNLKGRITWDDDPSRLLVRNAELVQGATQYNANGEIDLGEVEAMRLDLDVKKGRIQDFITVFDELVHDFWWFPHSLNGEISGPIQLRGGLSMDRLEVSTQAVGTNLEFYGERFTKVRLKGGYDKGKYYLSDVLSQKRNGEILASISYDASENFEWDIKTRGFSITDLDHVARLDVPIRAKVIASSKGRGKFGALNSVSSFSASEVMVRGIQMASSELQTKSENGVLELKGNALGGQGILNASINYNPSGQSRLDAELKRLDFSPFLLLLNSKSIDDPSLAGFATGKVDLKFPTEHFEWADGKVEIKEFVMSRKQKIIELEKPVSWSLLAGTFSLDRLALKGPQGLAVLRAVGVKGQLDGKISGTLDGLLAEYFTPAIAQVNGVAKLDFDVNGTIRKPEIKGSVSLNGMSIKVQALDTPFENFSGKISLKDWKLSIERMEAELAGGRFLAGGNVELYLDRYPKLDIWGDLFGNKLKIYPFQYAKVRGRVKVNGTELPYLVSGDVQVESALSKEKLSSAGQMSGQKTVNYMPAPSPSRDTDYPLFKLAIQANSDGGLLFQNELFDVEMKGKVKLVNTLEAPRLLGSGELVKGNLVFKDRVFQIQSANVQFDNPTVINPAFNMTAIAEVNSTKVQIYAAGRLDKYKIDFTSNPVMAESEILSLLALGLSPDDFKKMKGTDRSTVDQSEAASLLLHSLDFNRDVKSKTGFDIQLDEAMNLEKGSSIFRSKSDETGASPKIVIKRKIGKKLGVSVGSTVGVGTQNQREVNAEYQVSPNFSVLGVWDASEGVGIDQQTESRKSFGLDLKLQKRFK